MTGFQYNIISVNTKVRNVLACPQCALEWFGRCCTGRSLAPCPSGLYPTLLLAIGW